MSKNKDWVGDSTSVFKSLGASNHSDADRANLDYYATSGIAIDKLATKFEIPHNVWEPCCGEGHLSERLKEMGHIVKSYDLVDRGYGEQQNFWEMMTAPIDGEFAIVTNPPYKYATEFVLHALELVPNGCLVCLFLKTTFLEGKRRYNEIFKNTPPC